MGYGTRGDQCAGVFGGPGCRGGRMDHFVGGGGGGRETPAEFESCLTFRSLFFSLLGGWGWGVASFYCRVNRRERERVSPRSSACSTFCEAFIFMRQKWFHYDSSMEDIWTGNLKCARARACVCTIIKNENTTCVC